MLEIDAIEMSTLGFSLSLIFDTTVEALSCIYFFLKREMMMLGLEVKHNLSARMSNIQLINLWDLDLF